ncbi:MAG: substrate-binding periplasmic protein [Bdellovibrionales bacterium]
MKNILLSAIVAALVAFGIIHFQGTSAAVKEETVYERVERTKTLRCGWNTEPPMLSVDANTGKVSGASVDIVERVASLLGWKVDWAEQAGWSEMVAGLRADRYDLVCNGKWVFASQTQGGEFAMPIYFTPVHGYGRADETRFDGTLSQLNSDAFTVTSMDGEVNYYIARDHFPQAKRVEYPTMTDPGQMVLAVLTKKADVTFLPMFLGNDYMQKQPGTLKQLTTKPIAVFDTAFMYKAGEAAFAGTINAALRELHANGFIDATLTKYGVAPSISLRVADPYKLPN